VCFHGRLFLLIPLSWDFFGGFLEIIKGSFSLGLALKTLLRRNKVGKLGLFWIVFWIEALGFHLFQRIYAKFLFLFSFFITCLFLFIFLNIVDLVYV